MVILWTGERLSFRALSRILPISLFSAINSGLLELSEISGSSSAGHFDFLKLSKNIFLATERSQKEKFSPRKEPKFSHALHHFRREFGSIYINPYGLRCTNRKNYSCPLKSPFFFYLIRRKNQYSGFC